MVVVVVVVVMVTTARLRISRYVEKNVRILRRQFPVCNFPDEWARNLY
jgi:hypothetical protein